MSIRFDFFPGERAKKEFKAYERNDAGNPSKSVDCTLCTGGAVRNSCDQSQGTDEEPGGEAGRPEADLAHQLCD